MKPTKTEDFGPHAEAGSGHEEGFKVKPGTADDIVQTDEGNETERNHVQEVRGSKEVGYASVSHLLCFVENKVGGEEHHQTSQEIVPHAESMLHGHEVVDV